MKMFDRVATAEISAAPRHGSRKGLHSNQPAITQYLNDMMRMMRRHASLDGTGSGTIKGYIVTCQRTYREVARACTLLRHI